VIEAALRLLPIGEIATGPAETLGLGPAYASHRCLDALTQGLARFPGAGWRLLEAALRSPVTGNRARAARALGAWPRSAWPSGMETTLRTVLESEPVETVRKRLIAVLDTPA
jgi:hypothetical protein